ncbi:RagB/SusD family nutrient uptake outer membrane protein [Flavitalea sp. BT771]|uniref:RagB/SusD family nutrient uptake outer membrane protein n=1 Tax=Flavitalea sp. BT771 TaxID=3063329 RepID=UPI0026E235DE|nr:RagB/SusD family nutrient uptake outer membrane protein [Flavitalea sp. BT771]MDO6432050.1 RagB/SusD family nutrient uptake outer membrane protein [Flavitalea sp. BT771]MDV6220959.1 RagB/SusD family nutrient uptake outer membrane protein [Flavitalea sp. BT771]
MKDIKKIIAAAVLVTGSFGCTKLNEKFQGDLTPDQVAGGSNSVAGLLAATYASMQVTYQDQSNWMAMQEMTTDELVGPTRGPDWDDNGVWRVLHAHAWDGDNLHIRECFDQLSGTVFAATDLLQYNPSKQQAAEARFLRAYSMFNQLDGWDQVPYRDPGESVVIPSRVRKGTEALTYIMGQLTDSVIPNIASTPVYQANLDAAKVLLMKCYLNKGVIANRATPTFDNSDMAKVISLADEIIGSNKYPLATNYFDNFAPTNETIGKENIWTFHRIAGQSTGGTGNTINSRWHLTMHYKQNPSGWNGFTTLSDFYNKFEATDTRRGVAYPTLPTGATNPGNRVNVGFLRGQQYDLKTDTALTDRNGAPLAFTDNVQLIETGTNLEVTGIRVDKYPIDYANDGSGNVDNDYVYFRISDVMLMKAEALLRSGGDAATALGLVNQIRTARGASPLGALTLDILLDERGRELYWEDFRRQDLIRFGKFLGAWQLKGASDPKYLLFTIPNTQLAVNPNLKQNPGY